jgi:hypothetical protein
MYFIRAHRFRSNKKSFSELMRLLGSRIAHNRLIDSHRTYTDASYTGHAGGSKIPEFITHVPRIF